MTPKKPIEPPATPYFADCGLPLDANGYPSTRYSDPEPPFSYRDNPDKWEPARQAFFAEMDKLHATILHCEQVLEAAATEYRERCDQFHDSEAAPREARDRIRAAKDDYAAARTVAALEAAEVALVVAEREQIIADRVFADTTAAAKAASYKLQRAEENLKSAKVALYYHDELKSTRNENKKREIAVRNQELLAQNLAKGNKFTEEMWARDAAEAARPKPPAAKPKGQVGYRSLSPIAEPNRFYPRDAQITAHESVSSPAKIHQNLPAGAEPNTFYPRSEN